MTTRFKQEASTGIRTERSTRIAEFFRGSSAVVFGAVVLLVGLSAGVVLPNSAQTVACAAVTIPTSIGGAIAWYKLVGR